MRNLKHDEITRLALGNISTLTISVFFFLTGISAGIFLEIYMSPTQKSGVAQYLLQYLLTDSSAMNYPNPFLSSLGSNLMLLFIIFIAGISAYGFPAALLALMYKGIGLGFSTCLILEELGFKGALLILTSVLPQNMLLVPAFILAATGAINFAMIALRRRRDQKLHMKRSTRDVISVRSYCIFYLLLSAVILIGCFIENLLFPLVI